jgi:anti-sigma factor RsiW
VSDPSDQRCRDFVELVTDYLDDALPTDQRTQVDEHLETCPGCQTVLAQWREVVRLTGRLADTDVDRVDADTRAQLLATFRHRHTP